jgi:hypothetical protein
VNLIVGVLGTAGLGAVVFVLVILARLTQKWEAVTHSGSHFRLFYLASVLVGLAAVSRLVRIGYPSATGGTPSFLYQPQSWFYLCFYHIPLAVGLTLSLALAWRNWGWLIMEKGK